MCFIYILNPRYGGLMLNKPIREQRTNVWSCVASICTKGEEKAIGGNKVKDINLGGSNFDKFLILI